MTQSTLVTEPGNGTLEVFTLPTDAEFLQTLITDVFQNYWDKFISAPPFRARCGKCAPPTHPSGSACWTVI